MDSTTKSKNINTTTLSKQGDSKELLGYIIVDTDGCIEVVSINHVYENDFIRFRNGSTYLMHLDKKNLFLSHKDVISDEYDNIKNKTDDIQILIKERSEDIKHHRMLIGQLIQNECTRTPDISEKNTTLEELSLHIKIIQKHLEYLRDPDLLVKDIENKETMTCIIIKMSPGVSTKIDDKTTATWTPVRKSQCEPIVTVNTEISSSLVPIQINQKSLNTLHHTLNMYNEYNYFDS
jgi:hypothetical protein